MAGEAGEGEDAPLMNGSEDTVVMSQLHGESAKEVHTGGGPDCGPLDALPFMSNAGGHSLEIAQLLIDARADVNKSSRPRGLHYLFHRACQSYMRYLTSNPPVSIKICAEITTTPLGKACLFGRSDLVDFLLAARADPYIRNTQGHTAWDLTSNADVLQALEKHADSMNTISI